MLTPRRLRPSARFLQFYFALGILVLGGFWFGYSQVLLMRLSRLWSDYAGTLAQQLEQDTQLRSRIYAKFMSRITEPSTGGSAELDIIFEEVIKKIDFPVIITDRTGKPISQRNLGSDAPAETTLARLVAELDSEYQPIPLQVPDADSVRQLGAIHYGLSPSTVTLRRLSKSLGDSVRALSAFSVLQLLLLVGFVGIGVWGLLVYKRREQEQIWTALAKETAHQMATPLSSFAAWTEMLRSESKPEVVDAMAQDLERMKEALDRFSRIGLPPQLKPQPLGPLIRHALAFVQRRAPKAITFTAEVVADPVAPVDEVLFSWMLENLLKNGVDAIGPRPGAITVSLRQPPDRRTVELEVIDSGEGVKVEKIFEPGVTTKKHGWGVGLALARRIVESYHRGRIELRESRSGRTVFAIILPVARPGESAPPTA